MDELTTQYAVPDYVLASQAIEVAAAAVALVACLVLVRRGTPALLGLAGAALTVVGSGLALVDTVLLLRGDPASWSTSEGAWQVVTYGRAIGLVLLGWAVLVALLGTRAMPVGDGR